MRLWLGAREPAKPGDAVERVLTRVGGQGGFPNPYPAGFEVDPTVKRWGVDFLICSTASR